MTSTRIAAADVLGRPLRMLVGGRLVEASDGLTMDSINPATGRRSAVVPKAGPEDVNRAVAAARAALPEWKALDYPARRAKLLEIARVLRDKADAFGLLDTLDTGNVYSAMRLDAIVAAEVIEYFAAIGFEIKGEVTHLDVSIIPSGTPLGWCFGSFPSTTRLPVPAPRLPRPC